MPADDFLTLPCACEDAELELQRTLGYLRIAIGRGPEQQELWLDPRKIPELIDFLEEHRP
jgi:hypothetical protein